MNTKCGHSNIVESCTHCQNLQRQWYKKLNQKGFEDIEEIGSGYLKKWTGISSEIHQECYSNYTTHVIDIVRHQPPNESIQSSWPEPNFIKEEELLNHPDIEAICQSIFKHRNNVITAKTMVSIWQFHCEGASLREIEKRFNIHNATVFRAIRRLEELTKVMDLEEKSESVVIRSYDPETDAPFVFSSWRNSVWFDTHTNDKIDPIFYRRKTKEIKSLLASEDISVRIACLKTNRDQIIGYCVLEILTLEFIYVKADYRNQGIATLLSKGFIDVSKPTTKIGTAIIKKKDLKTKENENGTREKQRKEA